MKRNETKYYEMQRNILKGDNETQRNEMNTMKRNILKCETEFSEMR